MFDGDVTQNAHPCVMCVDVDVDVEPRVAAHGYDAPMTPVG
jgi:hypothetical protein